MQKHLKIPQNHRQQTNKQTDNRHISSIWYSLTIHPLFKDVFKYMITPCLQPCLRHVYTHVYTKFTPVFTAYLKICLNHIWEYIRRMLVDKTLSKDRFTTNLKNCNLMLEDMFTSCLNTWLYHICLNACLQIVWKLVSFKFESMQTPCLKTSIHNVWRIFRWTCLGWFRMIQNGSNALKNSKEFTVFKLCLRNLDFV